MEVGFTIGHHMIYRDPNLNSPTGSSFWKITIVNGYKAETKHFWPNIGKAKMCLQGGSSFKNCKQSAEKCKQNVEN